MSACVKPGEASWKSFNLKLSSVEKLLVYCGYLKLRLREVAAPMAKNEYGRYLLKVVEEIDRTGYSNLD